MQTKKNKPGLTSHKVASAAVSTILHLTAIATMSAVFCWMFINERALALLPEVWSDGSLGSEISGSVVIVTGLAACAWAMLNIVVRLAQVHARERKARQLKPQRGTIITETLIVLPVFLLLTFGLAQMGINSMASMLGTVATYEAARTIAVWGPEVNHDRTGEGAVTHAIVEDRARIAAAGILTPVVPSLMSGLCQASAEMDEVQKGMIGALGITASSPTPLTSIASMAEGFDTQTFAVRGVAKFRLAYCATTVTYTRTINTDPAVNDRNPFTTRMQYAHPASMPLVGPVFTTSPGAGPWLTPYVTMVDKSYELTQQLPPNPELPKTNIIRAAFNALGSVF